MKQTSEQTLHYLAALEAGQRLAPSAMTETQRRAYNAAKSLRSKQRKASGAPPLRGTRKWARSIGPARATEANLAPDTVVSKTVGITLATARRLAAAAAVPSPAGAPVTESEIVERALRTELARRNIPEN